MTPWYLRIFGRSKKSPDSHFKDVPPPPPKAPLPSNLPTGRTSYPTAISNTGWTSELGPSKVIVDYNFIRQIIPIIRYLSMNHPEISQVVQDVIFLSNTGYKLHFDPKVTGEDAEKMRRYIKEASKEWAPGQAGIHGIINKMFAQVLIGGALSNEWVPSNNLDGIKAIRLVNPESIFYKYDVKKDTYAPLQLVEAKFMADKNLSETYRTLNLNTFKYFGLNGDTEIPYGFPPYLSVVTPLKVQSHMSENMDFIVDVMGLLGFLEVLVDKPIQNSGEADEAYIARLNTLLSTYKNNILSGMRDGVVTGFKDDHVFKFNSMPKSSEGASELYKLNEMRLASAIKQDPVLMGRDYNTSETQITVVFNKMIASLKNMQLLVASNLEFGFTLALRLAGFKFEYLNVTFNRSTIQDDLKFQQAEEIKIRNIRDKLILGLINQDTAADEAGYDTPAFSEPRVPLELLAGKAPADSQDQKDEKAKDKSDKKVRDKNKPIPKDYKS